MREKSTMVRISLRAKKVLDKEAKEMRMTTAKYLNFIFLKEAADAKRVDNSTQKNT